MVKKKLFLRMARSKKTGEMRTVLDKKYNPNPMWSSTDPCCREYLATAHFAVEVDIPDEKFLLESETVKKMNFELKNNRLVEKL